MRVLFIHNRYQQPGGEDVAVEIETAILKERGHETSTLFFQNKPVNGILNKLMAGRKAIYNPDSYEKIVERINSFRPDIIHVHNLFFEASPAVLIAARKMKIPLVLTLHNYRTICANALLLRNNLPCELCINETFPLHGIRYKCYHDSAAESAMVTTVTGFHKLRSTWKDSVDLYITLTEFSRSRFEGSSIGVQAEKLVVKPNCIPDPGEGDEQRDNYYLYAGRISTEKGIEQLLAAFSAMQDCQLLIAGSGPREQELREAFKGSPNIIFKGQLDRAKILNLMRRAKALIFPSIWYEGLPFTIIESFSSGTPVIASKLGSMIELIEDGYNGYHFQAGDILDLRSKILKFDQSTGAERQRMQVNARTTYLHKYHPETHYRSIMEIYSRVLRKRKA